MNKSSPRASSVCGVLFLLVAVFVQVSLAQHGGTVSPRAKPPMSTPLMSNSLPCRWEGRSHQRFEFHGYARNSFGPDPS